MNHEYAPSTEYSPIFREDYGKYIVDYFLNQKVGKYIGWVKINDKYYFATSKTLMKMFECLKIKVTQELGGGYAKNMRLSLVQSDHQDIPYREMTHKQRKFALTTIDNQPKGKKMKKKAKTTKTTTKDADTKTITSKISYKYEEVDGKLIVYKIEKVAEYKVK